MAEETNLTEEQALASAAEQGIEFVDSFAVVKVSDLSTSDENSYETRDEAETALAELEDSSDYTIIQRRERKQ